MEKQILDFNPLDSTATENPGDKKFTLEYNIYGSSRLGILRNISYHPPSVLATANFNGDYVWVKNRKFYELSNHLGNVMVEGGDYFPFGMGGRSFSSEKYRFSFNGKEKG